MAALMDLLVRRGRLLTLDELRTARSRAALQAAVRARCQAVTLDGSTVLCRVLGRYKMLADSRDLGLAPHLLLDGYWEMWCTAFVLKRLRPGMVAWDIGANLGYYAVVMADLVGAEGRVLAVEPNPRLAALCERNLSLNGFAGRAAVRQVAAADRGGATLRFRAAPSDPKNGHVVAGDAAPADAAMEEFTVPAARLDDLGDGPVDFIKVDVEGAEEAAWAGMGGVLDRSPGVTVLMEFNAGRCRAPEAMLAAIAARFPLRELGTDGAIRGVSPAAILPRREDTMLVLTRGAA